ncbi:MAG: formamidase, partial [Tissierellia bacterium]|nr:formamidase [Tissierellia bacterium]
MKTISNKTAIFKFKPQMEPVERVVPGEIFRVITNGCYAEEFAPDDEFTSEVVNRDEETSEAEITTTGPIFVEGAEVGDILKVKILNINLSSQGFVEIAPNQGVLGHKVKEARTKILPIKDQQCYMGDISIPIRPMVGVIGVAPANEEGEFGTSTPWKHGGNIDVTDITESSVVYLPVQQKGALLGLG